MPHVVADPALTGAADDVQAYLTDNLPTVIGIVVAFTLASVALGFIRGLKKNKVS
jgi:hypothetical protein